MMMIHFKMIHFKMIHLVNMMIVDVLVMDLFWVRVSGSWRIWNGFLAVFFFFKFYPVRRSLDFPRPLEVSQHFADGETFGVYGEILPAQEAKRLGCAQQPAGAIPALLKRIDNSQANGHGRAPPKLEIAITWLQVKNTRYPKKPYW